MTRISTTRDLQTWVVEHMACDLDWSDIIGVVQAILDHKDRPCWDTDWQPFFDKLPEHLIELIPA